MKKDQLLTRRAALIAGAGAVGAAATAGVLTAVTGEGPARPAAPAAGAQAARRPPRASAYRLQPLTGYAPPRAAPRRVLVRGEPLLRVSGRGRTMVLTFDDGPDPRYTPAILDVLAEYEVRAMFFVCGEMIAGGREMLARMTEEGHVVGNHTWSHPLLTRLTRRQIRSQMERTSDAVEDACGERPEWFRAPYGAWNRAALRIGAALGMEPLGWTLDTLDWTTPGVRSIVRRVERGAAPGVVVLSHDAGGDRSQSVRALRRYLPELLDSGYHVTVPRRPDA
ncbi:MULTISPECIES: polysaccharide deacetylase family protein [Streptomyces]|uniref:Polysaccharide deacetylase family protein n=1 Tax=Streptomyces dubilierae TaxID=3075533 RepID=A0ABU2PKX8_9ACTN|nr:polysaccharide deacetylase family protein [Streptomyces sp. DSM 41921]MDT0392813.1 polysaccharide deacetylase family protein [Streptomyces sp. DSM 41921]